MEDKVEIRVKSLKPLKSGFLINGNWYAKDQCQIVNDDWAIVPLWLARLNDEKFHYLYNRPEKIEPEYNQEALDELRY